jgi:CTD small phosphatase-like protein 2
MFTYTLVLDLDETLVHFEAAERKFRLRPGCLGFLRGLSHPYFEIVVFTAASQDYADFILDVLDPERTHIRHRLYRQHTRVTPEGIYVKDLARLGRDLTKTIIVDNIPENFAMQEGNGIEIKTWHDDPADRELEILAPFLRGIVVAQLRDVRPLVQLYKKGGSSWRQQHPPKQEARFIR